MSDVDTLWVHRRLVNWLDVYHWGLENGFPLMFTPSTLHVTVATCRQATNIEALGPLDHSHLTIAGGHRSIVQLGRNGAQCLVFESQELVERHRDIAGRVPVDHNEGLQPHMTLCRHRRQIFTPKCPYEGDLIFGPEIQGRFVANFKVQQRAVDANDVRKLLGLEPLPNKPQSAAAARESAQEDQRRQRDRRRTQEDLDDLLGDDDAIRQKLMRRL